MKQPISNNLVSAVLNRPISFVRFNNEDKKKNYLEIGYKNGNIGLYNIYELVFHKCIAWVFKNKYYLYSDKTSCEIWKNNMLVHTVESDIRANDCPSYVPIILASEWVLQDINK